MLRRREAGAYAAGDFGFNIVWQSIELYLLFYYVRRLGLSPEVASAIFLAGAAVDWLTDPLVGALADRLASRFPLRLWVSVGGPLSVLMLCVAFAPPPVPGPWMPAYELGVYLLLRCAYGLGNIPYAALTARISADPADHLKLTSARMQGAAAGGLVATLTYALLPVGVGAGADFRLAAIVLALLALPSFLVTSLRTRERIAPPATATLKLGSAIGAMVTLLGRSSALRRLLATIVTVGLAVTLTNKSLLFLFDQIGQPRLGYYLAPVSPLSLLLAAPLWTMLADRIGQVSTLRIAALLMLGAVMLLVAGIGVLPCLVVSIVAGQGLSVMFWSLVPATVTLCEHDDGADGYAARVYAAATMGRKLAQALAPQIIVLALSLPALSIPVCMVAAAVAVLLIVVFYPPIANPNPLSGT